MDLQKVYAYIDAHQEEYIALLQRFVRQPSVSAKGEGMEEMAQLLVKEMTDIGIDVEVCPTKGNPILFGTLKGEREKVLSFYNHYDVQPPEPLELWHSEPFAAEIRDGKMFGRGASDNKGALTARLCAVRAVLETHGKVPLNLKFIYEGEEEIGSVHLHEFVEQYPDRLKTDGFAWEGASKQLDKDGEVGPLEVCLGVKGLLYLELRCKTANGDMHSAEAAIVKNPAWCLVHALSTMKNEKDEITIDGFYDNVAPVSQVDLDSLHTLRYREGDVKERNGLDTFINDLTGIPLLEKLHFQPTANIAGFCAGYISEGAKTVLPGHAVVKMDLRLVPNQMPDEILAKVRAHLDARGFQDIEVVRLSGEPPFRADPNCDFAKAVVQSAKEVYGVDPEVFVSSAGTTAMYQFCHEAGLDAVMFGTGNDAGNIHAPNENVIIKDYIDGIKMVATLMARFAEE